MPGKGCNKPLQSILMVAVVWTGALWANAAASQEDRVDLRDTRAQIFERMSQSLPPRQVTDLDFHRSLEKAKSEARPKIVGGEPVPDGFFNETVGIGGRRGVGCSGVIVSSTPPAVLTAAHCVCDLGLLNLGPDSNTSDGFVEFGSILARRSTRRVKIDKSILFDRRFCDRKRERGIARAGIDLALLLLRPEDVGDPGPILVTPGPDRSSFEDLTVAAPARIASSSHILSSRFARFTIVGYGLTETRIKNQKYYAVVRIASRICGSPLARSLFGCDAGVQSVLASPFGSDTCAGDSGGPVFAIDGSGYYLVAITSRAIDPRGGCGPGGVYTLVTPRVVNWMRAWGIQVFATE